MRSSGVPVACPNSCPSHSCVNTYIQLRIHIQSYIYIIYMYMLSKVHSVHLTIPNHQGTSSCPPATLDLQCRRMETRFRMVISWFISKPNTTLFVSDKSRNMCICLHQLESSHFGYPAVNHDSNGNSQKTKKKNIYRSPCPIFKTSITCHIHDYDMRGYCMQW